jgi:hypothetical protein
MITTYTSREVNPLRLEPHEVDIRDIAHALALCNRFAGHTPEPISVAQHSIYVSNLCPDQALQALLHDASEAYLGDVTKWLKATSEFAAYRAAEERIQKTIFVRFGCSIWLHPQVEDADRLMVRFEALRAYGPHMSLFQRPNYPALSAEEIARVGTWSPWAWRSAEIEFLRRFEQLYKTEVV